MDLRVFGTVHIVYLLITLSLSFVGLFLAKKYAKNATIANLANSDG